MTLAAAYKIGQVQILLADTLITGNSHRDHRPIPTRVDLNEPLPLEWTVTVNGLNRKSVVICDNVAVAAAGSGLGASIICREIQDRLRNQRPDAATFAAVLSEMDYATSGATRCTLVGWIIAEPLARSFQWDSATPKIVEWDQDFITGTGANLFRAIAWSKSQPTWKAIDGFDHAQHYALTQISSLLLNEIVNRVPIQNLFGGAYDLLLWDGERFRQGADVTFLFLSIDWLRSSEKRINDPAPILFRQAEVEDCLVVRALLATNQLGVPADKRERAAVIAPITARSRHDCLLRTHNWSEIALLAEHIFVVITGTGPAGTPEHWAAGVRGDEAKEFKIEVDTATGKLRFHLPVATMDNMLLAAELQFGRAP